jgi:DNA-binding protein HU-beta
MATAKKPMTKSAIAAHFAEKFALPKKVAVEVLDELAALAAAETKKIGAFTLPGVGKLVKAKRKARMGRNPATGATIKIPAKTVVKARLSKAFKEIVAPGGK